MVVRILRSWDVHVLVEVEQNPAFGLDTRAKMAGWPIWVASL